MMNKLLVSLDAKVKIMARIQAKLAAKETQATAILRVFCYFRTQTVTAICPIELTSFKQFSACFCSCFLHLAVYLLYIYECIQHSKGSKVHVLLLLAHNAIGNMCYELTSYIYPASFL